MGDNPDDYRIISRTKQLKPEIHKAVEYLDVELSKSSCPPQLFRKTGFHVFGKVIKLIPSNFNCISYLDLDACCYAETINPKRRKQPYRVIDTMERQINILLHSILSAKFLKIKRRGYDIRHYLLHNNWPNEFPRCSVLMCFLQGSNYKMKTFLKYGFQRIPTSRVMGFLRRGQLHPLYRLFFVLDVIRNYDLLSMHLNLQMPPPHWQTHDLHRAFMLLEILYAVCQMPCGTEDLKEIRWMRCCTLLWRSIPDHYFSLSEVESILNRLKVPGTNEGNGSAINQMCQEYKQKFPKVREINKFPRSMLHLCRCFIRDHMGRNHMLPDGIDRLEIIPTLKSYLKLEW